MGDPNFYTAALAVGKLLSKYFFILSSSHVLITKQLVHLSVYICEVIVFMQKVFFLSLAIVPHNSMIKM